MKALPEEGSRTSIVLLSLIVGAALLLGLHSYRTGRDYRMATQRVVRDYSAVAAGELITRAGRELDMYVTAPVFRSFIAWREQAGPTAVPALSAVLAIANPRQREALEMVGDFLVLDLTSGQCMAGPGAMSENLCAALKSQVVQKPLGDYDNRGYRAPSGKLYIYGKPSGAAVFAYQLRSERLPEFIGRSFGRAPLIPRPLGVGNELLFLDLVDPAGKLLFRAGGGFKPSTGIDQVVENPTMDFFNGSRIRASLEPDAVNHLVYGGVPPSSLPMILVLLGLTVALFFAALRQLRKERALARVRSDFVSSVSHELRTPLTQIRMFTETLLLERVRSPLEARRALEIVDQEARRLAHLVENVLRLTQSERGRLQPVRERIDLSEVVAETIDRFAPLAAAKNARLQRFSETSGDFVLFDREAMQQVILNLLDNALKYGPEGQQIDIKVEKNGHLVKLSVEDEGPGIPPRDRERIFQKFVRLDREYAGARAGSGIGLAVVSDLVQLHGGTSRVEERTGGGARFVIEIPSAGEATDDSVGDRSPGDRSPGDRSPGDPTPIEIRQESPS